MTLRDGAFDDDGDLRRAVQPIDEVRNRTDGMTLLLADMQVPAVEISPIPKLGRNAIASCEVVFDDLFVADADVVGEVGQGFHHLLDGLNPERILLAAEALGIGRVLGLPRSY